MTTVAPHTSSPPASIADREQSAWRVLRRGLAGSPELRDGLAVTASMGFIVAVGQIVAPVLVQMAIDRGGLASGDVDMPVVMTLVAGAFVVAVIAAGLSFVTQRRLVIRSELALRNLRVRVFEHVHQMSIADHHQARTGVLITRVTGDVQALSRFADWGMFAWLVRPVLIVCIFVAMAFYSWPLALLGLSIFVLVIPILRFLQRRMIRAHDGLRTATGTMVASYAEALNGAEMIRGYHAEPMMQERLSEASSERYRYGIRANLYMSVVFVVGDLLGAVVMVSILTVGFFNRVPLGLSVGDFVALLFLTTLLHAPVGDLGETLNQAQEAIAGWRKILDLLDQKVGVPEPTAAHAVPLPAGPVAVTANSVWFAYGSEDESVVPPPVLRDVSVDIPAGSNVAIVGATGSGKTTFAKLLCRLADPAAGQISLNGAPLARVSAQDRHRAVRLVPQDGFLFDATIRQNIAFGKDGAADADIAAAVSMLELEDWIATLPAGLDTEVGERGNNLSVGERQLVAFARAAVADPGLLILDEATSSVDPETDQGLTYALRRLAEGRTVISIAHRLATAEAADLVLVFDEGKIVEAGAPAELAAAGGVYTDLLAAWNS